MSPSEQQLPPPEQCWAHAATAAKAGKFDEAVHWFRHCLEQMPDFPNAALNLGILLSKKKQHAEAIQYLNQAVTLNSNVDSVSALANAHRVSGSLKEAIRYYQDIIKSVPGHVPTLIELGEIYEQIGNRRAARDYYRQATEAAPKDVTIATKYAIASWADDPAETAAVLDRHLARDDIDASSRAKIIMGLIIYKEFYERIKRGLMPYHATSLDELFFTYAAKEFEEFFKYSVEEAEKNPADFGPQVRKFLSLFCSRRRIEAQKCIAPFQSRFSGQIWDAVTFDPAFYKKLELFTEQDIVKTLPPLTSVIDVDFSDAPIAYLSCNFLYFEGFGAPMLRSLAAVAPGAQAHVHIMDATEKQLEGATHFCRSLPGIKVALSVEQPGVDKMGMQAARSYYHAIRFIRFYQHLEAYRKTLWLMDVDALFNQDPKVMYEKLGNSEAAMRIRAGRLEPWNQFNACIVAGTAAPESLEYFRLIAAYTAHFHQTTGLRWGIDQLAMYGVFEYLRDEGREPSLTFLDDRAIDYDYKDDGVVWCNSGKNKFLQLQRKPDGTLAVDDPDRAAYIKLFDKYYKPLRN